MSKLSSMKAINWPSYEASAWLSVMFTRFAARVSRRCVVSPPTAESMKRAVRELIVSPKARADLIVGHYQEALLDLAVAKSTPRELPALPHPGSREVDAVFGIGGHDHRQEAVAHADGMRHVDSGDLRGPSRAADT